MGLFFKDYTCPKCGKVSRVVKWITPTCPYCMPVVIPNYDIIGRVTPVGLNATQVGLYRAGLSFTGAHVCESEQHPDLMRMATRHAKYQADHRQQGHQLFDSRVAELRKTVNTQSFAEIAAESWERQKDATPLALGVEMFACWAASPGHWGVASKKHKYFGCDMALGSNNIWYACIITGD